MNFIKAYIDIDGVLLRNGKNGPELIPRFKRVVAFLKEHYDCYWLTTHVRHGSGGAVAKMAPFLRKAGIELSILEGIGPTEWRTLKTEAIDFDRPFIWLEDDPLPSEIQVLRANKCVHNLEVVDWRKKTTRLTVRRFRRILRGRELFLDFRV
ncbi:MAG TPA: hypothetical protein PLP83_10650 [Candidatus Aminicenantes bacterium]|nr:hypothetical protein [Candidatus Aminicenantes bacterium]